MKKKSYNYKFIIGLVIGLVLVGVVSADAVLEASNVYYVNKDTDVQSAIDYLADNIEAPESCPSGYVCEPYKNTLAVGDYVSYTPSKTSYTTDTDYTGYTSAQTINPSELNLWRVLNINDDGTVDLISEYVSSTAVYFSGKTGYLNFVGYLNTLAEQYETDGITVGSRYFGYNGQTEFLNPDNVVFTEAPWTSSTSDNSNEAQGGGDTLYTTDYNQLNTALGTRVAYRVGTSTATSYWIASRYYVYSSSSNFKWNGRYVSTSGSNSSSRLYYYSDDLFNTRDCSYALRPIVTLSSTLKVEGLGSKDSPWKIITS